MTQFSSKPPFNDDPNPYVWAEHSPRNKARIDTEMYRVGVTSEMAEYMDYEHSPRPEYDRPQHNPTNPILVARRNNPGGNIYYKDLDRWPTFEEIYHAHVVLTRRKAVFG